MKKLLNILFISLVLISVGCMSDTGRVYLDTKPEGAMVYINDRMIGETPIDFEFTHDFAVELKIKKDGYYPITEILNTDWVHIQMGKGHFKEYQEEYERQEDMNKGEVTQAQARKWKIVTTYELKKKNEK